MALFRALESSRRPPEVRLFEDPLASALLPPSLAAVAGLSRVPPFGAVVPWLIDRRWPGARTSGVARTRLIDDALRDALAEGIAQVVILGAGFDSRAYRLRGIEQARVFEVDHPDTLAAKRERVRQVLGVLPDHVVFVAVDFNWESLAQAMDAAGLDRMVRTFFVWEGVTNYLTEEAVHATLRSVAAAGPAGSRLLFTYVHTGLLDGSVSFDGTRALMRTLRRADEPWTFGFDPARLPSYLAARGFALVADLGASEYRGLYFGAAADRMRGYEFYRAATAVRQGAISHG
jgi:methyltransferase (TIGR00027 family)